MRHCRRICFTLVIAAVSHGTFAYAQVAGPGPIPQADAGNSSALNGTPLNSGLSQPALQNADLKDSTVRKAPPAQQRKSAHFTRVTSTRREAVVLSPPGGTSASAGTAAPSGALHPYSAQAAQMAASGASIQAPAGSSWQDGRRPATPPRITVRSTTHNYYPTMRPAQGPNANVPAALRMRQPGIGSATGMMAPGMMGGAPGPAVRNGQFGSRGRAQSGATAGRR